MKFHVDESSYLARLTDWHGRRCQRNLGAIGANSERALMFTVDEVLVGANETELVKELTAEHKATVVTWPKVPAGPPNVDPRRAQLAADAPLPLLLRFSVDPKIEDPVGQLQQLPASNVEQTITSQSAAKVAALVAGHASQGRRIGLNLIGRSSIVGKLPYSYVEEGIKEPRGPNPFSWPYYNGPARIVQAWQLLESWRQINGHDPGRPIIIGILDGGFDLDVNGVPYVGPFDTASDFGTNPYQLNLTDDAKSRPAGGPNPITCSGGSSCPWHGNGTAGVAAGAVDDSSGIAGAGGTVAVPALFKTDTSLDQIYYCLQVCQAWGVSVLNMSFGFTETELTELGILFDLSTYNDNFQFAADHGLIMVAAAGNWGNGPNAAANLPDDLKLRPATRTPGVITVGALNSDGSTAWPGSNYGSSVDIWAPGVSIDVGPDHSNPQGSASSGTSLAAPIVAGVAAMLRYLDPTLDSAGTKQVLKDTGWAGTGHVTVGLDAYAAVLQVMGNKLPDNNEPNDTPATAVELQPIGPNGALACSFTGISGLTREQDWWKFSVTSLSTINAILDWYLLIANCVFQLTADDPDSPAPDELQPMYSPGGASDTLTPNPSLASITGVIGPGTYRLQVASNGLTAYRLLVNLTPLRLTRDQFEPNDSFDTASRMYFVAPPSTGDNGFREWGPGTYSATLHLDINLLTGRPFVNPDYFLLNVPISNFLGVPTVVISHTDEPIDVTLYDSARNLISSWADIRSVKITPPADSTCYLLVTGQQQTRYTIQTALFVDYSVLPGPLHTSPVYKLPPWWGGDLRTGIEGIEQTFLVQPGTDISVQTAIAFERAAEIFHLELLNDKAELVRRSAEERGQISMNMEGLAPGNYFLRVARKKTAIGTLILYRVPVE